MERNNNNGSPSSGPSTSRATDTIDVTTRTRNPSHDVPVCWRIENALTFTDDILTSILRVRQQPCKTKINLVVKLDEDATGAYTEVCVGFQRTDRQRFCIALKYDLSLKNCNGYVYGQKKSDLKCEKDVCPHYCITKRFTKRSASEDDVFDSFLGENSGVAVLEEDQRLLYRIPDDVLIVEGGVSITGCCATTTRPNVGVRTRRTPSKAGGGSQAHVALRNDFLRAYENKMYTDITLVVDGRRYFAHKFVLAARSPVLKQILEPESADSAAVSEFELRKISNHIFEVVLEFLYSGEFEDDPDYDTISCMYEVGVQWKVDSLVEECRRLLLDDISDDTACKVLLLADMNDDEDLRDGVISYVAKNYGYIEDTEEWEKLKDLHPRLVVKVLTQIMPRKRKV